MENEVQPIIQPVQSLSQTPTLAPVPIPPLTNWTKIILLSVLGLVVVAGAFLIGVQVGKNQTSNQQPIAEEPTATPTQIVVSPTTIPTSPVTATPTIDPTANWKTYTNKEYNLTIKYPSDAKLRISQSESNDKMLLVAFDSPNAVFDRLFKSGGYSFEISMQTQKNFNTLNEYLLFQKEHSMYEEVLPKTYNNVNGYTFKNDKGYSGLNFTYRGFVAKNNELYYTINYFTDDSVDMFNQILSTFKFTN
jgi:hypothetical protein